MSRGARACVLQLRTSTKARAGGEPEQARVSTASCERAQFMIISALCYTIVLVQASPPARAEFAVRAVLSSIDTSDMYVSI